jgi:hypothetical protein
MWATGSVFKQTKNLIYYLKLYEDKYILKMEEICTVPQPSTRLNDVTHNQEFTCLYFATVKVSNLHVRPFLITRDHRSFIINKSMWFEMLSIFCSRRANHSYSYGYVSNVLAVAKTSVAKKPSKVPILRPILHLPSLLMKLSPRISTVYSIKYCENRIL